MPGLTFLQILSLAVVFLAYLVYKFIISPYLYLRKLGLGVPFPLDFLGNTTDLGPTKRHYNQLKRLEKYGRIHGTLFFHFPAIWVGEPEVLQTILIKEFSNFTNRFAFTNTLKPFDKSLFDLQGADWKRVRTIVLPTFSTAKLKLTFAIINDAGDHLCERMMTAEQEGRPIELRDCCGKFAMEVILGAIFGIEYESEEQERKVTEAAAGIFATESGFLQFLAIISPTLFRILEPMVGGKLIYSIDYLMAVTKKVIEHRRKNLRAGVSCRGDILQLMIEAGDHDKLDNEEIIAQAFVFLVAGYETTANTLTFLSHILAVNPDVQQKVYEEISSKYHEDIGIESLQDLPYLDMVIAETMRLYPAAYAVDRLARDEITIKGFRIPKGMMIGIPIYSLHHDPMLWPDPEKFIPERFTPEEKAKRHPCSYLAFGNGPRNCIGMRFAILELKLAIVKVVSRLELIMVKQTERRMETKTSTALLPAKPVYVGIRRRH
ncbi:Cytochrome P450 3A24 [Trichoplax sp. H2]|nr:Cytochrome P450 3A24 [Trichoplax sp. H2]|eukprot:RDD37248.1 Cytochrome P450 3A24 [Trichoplax sp. H2]